MRIEYAVSGRAGCKGLFPQHRAIVVLQYNGITLEQDAKAKLKKVHLDMVKREPHMRSRIGYPSIGDIGLLYSAIYIPKITHYSC